MMPTLLSADNTMPASRTLKKAQTLPSLAAKKATSNAQVMLPDVGFFSDRNSSIPMDEEIGSARSETSLGDDGPFSPKSGKRAISKGALKLQLASQRSGKPMSAPARHRHAPVVSEDSLAMSPTKSPKSPKKVIRISETPETIPPRPARRASLPCLKVSTSKRPDFAESGGDMPRRHVSFIDRQELFEAFTPYSKKYGAHPDDFFFDNEGRMVLTSSSETEKDVHDLEAKDTIECLVEGGVDYHKKPQFGSLLDKQQKVALGDQLIVKRRFREWVQDKSGWLPLFVKGKRAFEVVVPKEQLKYATARVPVMGPSSEPASARSSL
jgi:hypothetical protein